MSRNIINYESFKSRMNNGYEDNYENHYEDSLEESYGEILQGIEEDITNEGFLGDVFGNALGSISQGVKTAMKGAGLLKDGKPNKALKPEEFFAKATATITQQVKDPIKAALILRNFFSRFLNKNNVPCNMINVDSKKEMKFADYQKLAKDKKANPKGAGAAAAKGKM